MIMKHLRVLAFLILASSSGVFSQCPTTPFSLPDSVCPGLPVTINNGSSISSSWSWDFSLGDLNLTPTISSISGGGSLNYPAQIKLIEEGGEFFGFVPNSGTNYITRYDFGNSPANTPTIVNLAADPIFSGFAYCMEMVKENNKWIGFLSLFTSGKIVRLEFDSIKQTNPLITDLGSTNLAGPFSIKIVNDYLFVTNQLTEISRFTFNGSYLNTPTPLLPNIQTGNFNNAGIEIVYDCQSGNYTGFVSSLATDRIDRIDFGASLANTPTVTPLVNMTDPNGISVIREGNQWHLFTVTENNRLFHYTFSDGPGSSLQYDYDSDFGGAFSGPKNIQFTKLNSEWHGIISNTLLFALRRLTFPAGNPNASPFFSSSQSPSTLQYASGTSGAQYIELTERYADGSIATFIDSTVVAILPPAADFTNSTGCLGRNVDFTDQSTSCTGSITQWFWTFGDGATSSVQNPSHIYSNAGNFQVILKIYNSIGDSATITSGIVIEPNPTALLSSPDSICTGVSFPLSNLSTSPTGGPLSSEWDFGDGNQSSQFNANHDYLQPGNYVIQLVTTSVNGCTDTIARAIRAIESPNADFVIQNTCNGENTLFLNQSSSSTSSISSSSWDFGDGTSSSSSNPSHTYPGVIGSYTVELVAQSANGCSDTVTQQVTVSEQPLPWFILPDDTVCEGFQLQIIDSSFSANGGQLYKRIWDFGDGIQDSTSLNPTHVFNSPGTYTIALKAISPTDCDSIVTRQIVVIEKPNALFTAQDACFGDSIQFTDVSTTISGTFLVAWEWSFGDSTTSFLTNPNHLFSSFGDYTVQLQITNSKGCIDVVSDTVRINPIPVADFANSKPCTGNPVNFSDSSAVASGSLIAWKWTFGNNGPTSTNQNPSFTFPNSGSTTITLEITSDAGCTDTLAKLIGVDQSPQVTLSAVDNCLGAPTPFQIQSAGSISFFLAEWDFGDSTSSNLFNPTHQYGYSGAFPVTVQVLDTNNNCVTSLSDTIIIRKNPSAFFESDSTCVNDSTQFIDLSSPGEGSLIRHEWDLGSLGTSLSQNPIIVPASPDSLRVTLIIENNYGCLDTAYGSLEVYPLPYAYFQPSTTYGAVPLAVDFTNLSENPATYNWAYGDGSPLGTEQNPLHLFNDTGTYNVNLTVTSIRGCKSQFGRTVTAVSPYLDLGIVGLNFNLIENEWKIKANLRNFGNVEVNDFSIKASLDGKSQIIESFNLTIPPSTNLQADFKSVFTAYDFDSPRFLCLEITEVSGGADESSENNKDCITTSSGFEILTINPNPASDNIIISLNTDQRGRLELTFTDEIGRIVSTTEYRELYKGFNSLLVDKLPKTSGIYFIHIRFKEKLVVKKLVIR